MNSEWMKVMLDEIARKKLEAEQAQLELERRSAAAPRAERPPSERRRAERRHAEPGVSAAAGTGGTTGIVAPGVPGEGAETT